MFDSPVDILILSNGPGEISTWVRPVVKRLRQNLTENRSLFDTLHAIGKRFLNCLKNWLLLGD